jgi:hypothetical protein
LIGFREGKERKLSGFVPERQEKSSIKLEDFIKEKHVALVTIFPGMKADCFRALIGTNPKAILIEGFGSAGVPFENEDENLLPCIEEAVSKGITIVLGTSCPSGGAEPEVYEVGLRALRAGAHAGNGQGNSGDGVRRLRQAEERQIRMEGQAVKDGRAVTFPLGKAQTGRVNPLVAEQPVFGPDFFRNQEAGSQRRARRIKAARKPEIEYARDLAMQCEDTPYGYARVDGPDAGDAGRESRPYGQDAVFGGRSVPAGKDGLKFLPRRHGTEKLHRTPT